MLEQDRSHLPVVRLLHVGKHERCLRFERLVLQLLQLLLAPLRRSARISRKDVDHRPPEGVSVCVPLLVQDEQSKSKIVPCREENFLVLFEDVSDGIEASEIQADLLRQLEQVSSSHTALANENEALRDEMTRLRTCVKERSEIWIDACRELISQLCEIQTVFLGLEENFLQYVDRHFSTNLEEDTHRSSHSSPVHTPLECPYPVGSGAAGAHGATMAMEQCARTGDNTSAQSISCHGWMADMAGLVNHIKDLLGEISQVQDMVDRCEPALEPNAQHTETIEATRVGKLDEFSVRVLLASLKELLVKSYDDTVRAIGEVRTSLLLESEAYGRVGHFARETWKENIRLRQETFDMTQELERVRQVVDGMKTHRCEDGNFMSKDEIQKIAEETVKANIQFRHEIFGMRQEMEQLQELVDGAKTREALWMGSEEIRRIAQDTVRENILLRQEIYDLSGELQQWQLGERRCGGNREEDCGRQNSYERSCGDVAAKIEEVETFSHLVGTASESQHPKTACVLPATGTENGEDEMMTSFCETEDIVKLVEDVLQHVAMGLQSQALLFSTSDRVDKSELAREYFEEDLQNVMDSQYNPSTCQLEGESAARPEDEMMILMDLISGFNDDMEHTCDIFQELISKSSPKAVSDDSVSVCQLIPSAASEEIQKERMEEMNRLLLLTEFSMAQSEMMLNDEKQQVERIVLVQESMLVRIERTFQNVEREATGLRVSMSDCCARLKEAEACIQLLERQLQAAKIEKEVEEERRRLQLQKEVEEAENKATRAELQVNSLPLHLLFSRLIATLRFEFSRRS
eukprot:760894-Hanusia_phi.AAC.3